jgi:hypothetical protein
MSQTPTRVPSQQPLPIRNSMPPGQSVRQPTQSSPPSQQQQQQPPYPNYPIAIPPEKFDRAVTLFGKLRLAEGLAQRAQEPAPTYGGSRLDIPGRSGPPSIASSGPHTPSATTSNYGGGGTTDMSSVVSFEDNESPSSVTANASTELISYDGRRVRHRTRRILSPTGKAKAALIRHLGSCWVCRSRRVQVRPPSPIEFLECSDCSRSVP